MTDAPLSAVVVVPTRNRGPKLVRCLEQLAAQRYPAFRILVADNGSTDDTAAVTRHFAATASVPVDYLFESARGGSNARNHAIRVSSGDVVAFVDDDCYADPEWLAAIMREFVDPAVGYCGGRVLLDDPTDAAFSICTSPTRFVRHPGDWNDGDDVTGSGSGIRRSALLRVGGFDPLLSPGSPFGAGEDIDMYSRLFGDGWVGVYTPEAVTYHGHGRKPGSPELDTLKYIYQRSRGAWYMKRFLFGPLRWRTIRVALSEVRGKPAWITRSRIVGGVCYLFLALPRLLRHGLRGVHPDLHPPSSRMVPS